MEIGNNLKKLRANKNMTQKELAEALNVSYQAVSRWENNEVEPDISTLSKLSQIFGVSVDQIINGDVDKPKEEPHNEEVAAVAAAVAAVAEKKEEAQETKPVQCYCYDCHRPIYEGEEVESLKRKFPDGHVESQNICHECYEKRYAEEHKDHICADCNKKITDTKEIHKVTRMVNGVKKEVEVCEACYNERLKLEQQLKTYDKDKKHKSGSGYKAFFDRDDHTVMIWSIIIGVAVLALTLGILAANHASVPVGWIIGGPILAGFGIFALIYCIFTDTWVSDVFVEISSWSIKLPGIIFTFDLEGLAFLIVMKILFAIIGALVGILTFMFAVGFSAICAIFTFPFVVGRNK